MLRNLPISASGRLRLLIGAALCSQLLIPAFAMADPAYDALIIQARNGNFTPALTQLRQLPAERQTLGQISDHLVIAGWAGQDAEVLKVYEAQGQNRNLTAQALATVARTYRNQKQWAQAEAVYRKALLREPNNVDLQLGMALTQADGGKASEAVQRTRALVAAKPEDPNRRMALGYALTRAGLNYDALFEFDQAFIRAGDKPEVAREYIVALQKARMPEPALRLAAKRPGLLDPVTQRRLEGDLAAERVRMAEFATRTEQERYVIADRALADYDKLLTRWTPEATAHDDVVRWRIDRLGALKARARTAQVIHEYETLKGEGVQLPTYAVRWVAASYLDQRQPEKAEPLYRQALSASDAEPDDRVEDSTALYYALQESDKGEDAREVANGLANSQKPRVELKGLPVGNPNDAWMDAQQLSAQAGVYGGDLPGSEAGLEALVAKAPGNVGLRLAQADMYRARDLPRRAEGILKETEAQAPRDIGLEVSQAYTAMDLQEWRQLDVLTDDVLARNPDNRQVQRLSRLRDVHDMAELRVEAYTGKSFGGGNNNEAGAVAGSRDWGIESRLYTPPIDEDWRLFAGAGYATADFEEGTGHHRWQVIGVERRTRDMTVEAEVSNHSYGNGTKQGAAVSIARDINDNWQYGGSLGYLLSTTPLRALNADITANGGSGFIRWRANESREWKLTLSPSHFSDGNDRFEALLSGREGLYSSPRVQVDLGLEVAASRNSKEDTVYFNPKSDFTVLPVLNINHVLYHRYETQWSQQFQVGAGTYSQQDYSTGGIGLVGYGQRYRWNDVLEAGANLSLISRPYDGDRERDLRLLVDLTDRSSATLTMTVLSRCLLILGVMLASACAQQPAPFTPPAERPKAAAEAPWPKNHFLGIAYHDVEDRDPDQAVVAVRTERLIEQLAWLRENGYQAVSVDQILAARRGGPPLPPKAIMLSFDDGYSSFYTRVMPILRAYRWPAVLAPVGSWIDTPLNKPVDFAGLPRPRGEFLTWQQIREVSQSGLVEIAAHTDANHKGILANPQGNLEPAAATRRYDPATKRYETEAQFQARMRADVESITNKIRAVTGKAPRVWVWPYGAADGTSLAVVGEHGYEMALTLEDGLDSLGDLKNSPRFLVASDPDGEHFANSMVAVQTPIPLRVLHVDLDNVYDPDPAQQARNLDQLVQRVVDMGASTVFLQAFADPVGDGLVHSLYFPNRHLPVRADLFNRVSWQLHTRAHASVYAWMPVMSFALDSKLPRVTRWDPESGKVGVDPDQYKRLSPFDPQVRKIIGEIYEDLARNAAVDGILFHDDAVLSDFEDASPAALKAYAAAGLPDTIAALRADPAVMQRWTRFKSRYLIDFTKELTTKVRAIRGPAILTARNIFAEPMLNPESEAWFAQNLDDFLQTYDWTAPMAMPLMEGQEYKTSNVWLEKLVATVKARPGAMERTVFELQAKDWRTKAAPDISGAQMAEWMGVLKRQGVTSFGYYPDNFLENSPDLKTVRPALSNQWNP